MKISLNDLEKKADAAYHAVWDWSDTSVKNIDPQTIKTLVECLRMAIEGLRVADELYSDDRNRTYKIHTTLSKIKESISE